MEKLRQCELDITTVNRRLCDKLVQILGTEEDIRMRQQMFVVMDTVNGFGDKDSISISTGSLSEGLDLKGSDEDMMLVLKYIEVIPSGYEVANRHNVTNVIAELDKIRPGYAKMYIHSDVNVNEYIKNGIQDICGSVLSSSKFRDQFARGGKVQHGPCFTDGIVDFAMSLHSPLWPQLVKDRMLNCESKNWLSSEVVERLMSEGCHFVPVGPKQSEDYHVLWRISFASVEKKLIHAMSYAQLFCYGLLKIFLKEGIETDASLKDLLCSYFLKTCMFWMIEETDNDEVMWDLKNLYDCFIMCLDRLIKWVRECVCPNYILTQNNMFIGRVHEGNCKSLLSALCSFKNDGFRSLCRCESLRDFLQKSSQPTEAEREATLDLFCFRSLHIYPFDDINLLFSAAESMDTMYNTENRGFVRGVINTMRAAIFAEIAQLVHTQDGINNDEHEIRKQQRLYLCKSISANLCGGLNLLASLYYVQGSYYTAIEMLNAVTRNIKPSLLHQRKPEYTTEERQRYLDEMCGRGLSLEQKMIRGTTKFTVILQKSPIMPAEFKPDVEHDLLTCPPFVYSYALKFLCYHHVGDQNKKREALTTLEDSVKSGEFILNEGNPGYAIALTIMGACYEVLDELDSARHYYELALKQPATSSSAKPRLDRLQTIK